MSPLLVWTVVLKNGNLVDGTFSDMAGHGHFPAKIARIYRWLPAAIITNRKKAASNEKPKISTVHIKGTTVHRHVLYNKNR
jgi:hypothetical protein